MDVVYVVRDGGNPELCYSLRSLANLPHNQVWIVGHAEPWLRNVRVIPTRQGLGKQHQVLRNWQATLGESGISDPFVVMADDIFVVEPVDELLPWHRGSLRAHADEGRGQDRHAGLMRTADLLTTLGVDDPLSYETHTPMLVDRQGWAEAIAYCAEDPYLAPKSLYANIADAGGVHGFDVKVHDDAHPADGPFVSTSDRSFARQPVGKWIRDRFPTPSPYELPR